MIGGVIEHPYSNGSPSTILRGGEMNGVLDREKAVCSA